MKSPWLARLLLVPVLWPCACARPVSQTAKTGQLEVRLAVDPDPPTTGRNQLLIDVKDAAGRAVDGAQVKFEYRMPGMGAMPEMKGGGDVQSEGGGRYRVTYSL